MEARLGPPHIPLESLRRQRATQGWADPRPSTQPWSQQKHSRRFAISASLLQVGAAWHSFGKPLRLCSHSRCVGLAAPAPQWADSQPGQQRPSLLARDWPGNKMGPRMATETQFWDLGWSPGRKPLPRGGKAGRKLAGAALAMFARAGRLGRREAHLLLPPLQGGKIEDPEVSGDTCGCKPPQQVHGPMASGHIGGCVEGAG